MLSVYKERRGSGEDGRGEKVTKQKFDKCITTTKGRSAKQYVYRRKAVSVTYTAGETKYTI